MSNKEILIIYYFRSLPDENDEGDYEKRNYKRLNEVMETYRPLAQTSRVPLLSSDLGRVICRGRGHKL